MKYLENAKTIVIKIGSTTLFDMESQTANALWFNSLIDDIAHLVTQGKRVAIVSSGAVTFGRNVLGIIDRPLRLEEKQAAAACGQMELIKYFQTSLQAFNLKTAQVLITLEDSNNRRRYLNAQNTLLTLLSYHIIPVINENDTVTTEKIRFGDNDRLAARVAGMVGADCLVLLSDIEGLYTADPGKDNQARFLPEIDVITDEIRGYAGGSGSAIGSGGMQTKIQAAEIAVSSGCHTIIALGKQSHPIRRLQEGGKHTVFLAHDTPRNARKTWIIHQINITGSVTVDAGAIHALNHGNSLLCAGIVAINGTFDPGDVIRILDEKGNEYARGITAYYANETQQIMGKKNNEIEDILGYSRRDSFIHRDDLVII